MGLDIDICTFGGDTLVSLRGHESFLYLLPLRNAPRVYPGYDDLLLTAGPVVDALDRVEVVLDKAGATLSPICPAADDCPHAITDDDIPQVFLDDEPECLIEAYMIYRVILTRLLQVLEGENLIFCFSA